MYNNINNDVNETSELLGRRHHTSGKPNCNLLGIVMCWIALFSLVGLIYVYYACVQPNYLYTESTCLFLETKIEPKVCCDTETCLEEEAGSIAPICKQGVYNNNNNNNIDDNPPKSLNLCGNGSKCIGYWQPVYKDCMTRDHELSQCYDGVMCTNSIKNQRCQQVCGGCNFLTTTFQYLNQQGIDHNQIHINTVHQQCNRTNSNSCTDTWIALHLQHHSENCWVSKDNHVEFENPVCIFNGLAHYVFYGFLLIIFVSFVNMLTHCQIPVG